MTNRSRRETNPGSPIEFQRPLAFSGQVEAVSHKSGALLISELERVDLSGRLFGCLIPLIDGKRTALDLVRSLKKERFQAPEILEAIGSLWKSGHITTSPARRPSEDALFWADTSHRAESRCMSVAVIGEDGTRELEHALRLAGITTCDSERAGLEIVVVNDYLDLVGSELTRRPGSWLPVKLVGRVGWIGPLFIWNETACWNCLEHRLRLNREIDMLLRSQDREVLRGDSALGHQVVAGFCATQAARWLRAPDDETHPLWGALATIDTVQMTVERHVVTRRPQCPVCGTGRLAPGTPVEIPRGRGTSCTAEGYRLISAEQVIERWGHHVSSITGIVSELKPVIEETAYVHRAVHVRAVPARSWTQALAHRRLVGAGKGLTPVAARAGALAEALERYSAMWDETENHFSASIRELGDEAIHPNDCMLFSARQFEEGGPVPCSSPKHRVPRILDENQSLTWVRAWSLMKRCWRPVAAATAFLGFPDAEENRFCVADSNGNAAGADREEAILQGTMELVERDSVAIWWYNRLPRATVVLEEFHPEYVRKLRLYYRGLQREFWVLDLTSDLGVPTFAGVSCRVDGGPALPAVGFGAHINAHAGILRALTEMNQMLPHVLAEAQREDRRSDLEEVRPDSMGVECLERHPYFIPDPSKPARLPSDYPDSSDMDLYEALQWCRQTFLNKGLDMLVLDLTRPDVGMPVVRVIVPGLRHFWRRLAPGRLYDVPVSEGWVDSAYREEDVNPLDLAI